ncbi:MAG: esterase-like activity of phytase family protein [Pseudobdellovibrionaceae bacterium]
MKLILNSALLIFVFCGLAGFSSFALELEYLNQVVLPHEMKLQKSKIGGLSGLFYEPATQKLFAVSDDRGLVNEPRLYEFKIQVSLKDFKVEPQAVIFLSVNESELSHKTTASSSKLFSRVLDLEAISMTPWGDFLLTNEGAMGKKPRVNPQFLSANASGTLMREFEVPKDYLPEPAGMQKKGVPNNLAFEGLAMNPNGKEWLLAMEAPLLQDPKGSVRFLQYDMPEAWVLKPGKEYKYPMPEGRFDPQSVIEFQKGVSELQFVNDHELLVMERLFEITKKGMKFQIQLYQTDLKVIGSNGLLVKKMILDLETLEPKIGKIGNFEGMAWGPLLSDGRQSLILVSDDNFRKDQRTHFLLFAVKTDKK